MVEYRATSNLTQKELAKKIGIAQAMVSKYESGDYNISIEKLCGLCEKMSWEIEFKISQSAENKKKDSFELNFNVVNFDADISDELARAS